MGRSLGQLQRDLEALRDHGEDREKRTELSLEELEALIAAKEEETNRRFQEQAQENAETIKKVNRRTDRAVCTGLALTAFPRKESIMFAVCNRDVGCVGTTVNVVRRFRCRAVN